MSIFNNDDNTNEVDVSDVTLDTLVGDGQKYKTPDELAKAYANADAYISTTKEKVAELEAKNKVLEDLMKAREKTPVEPPKAPDGSKQEDPPANHGQNKNEEKDLSTLIQEELERTNKEKTFADNVNSVSEKLSNYFGGEREAKNAIAKKAKDLNVSTEWLMDIAGRSPAAFYSTVGLDSKSLSTPASVGDVNTAAFSRDSSRKNFRYYEEIRKTNPKLYYSQNVQRELFASAREQGERFYT